MAWLHWPFKPGPKKEEKLAEDYEELYYRPVILTSANERALRYMDYMLVKTEGRRTYESQRQYNACYRVAFNRLCRAANVGHWPMVDGKITLVTDEPEDMSTVRID